MDQRTRRELKAAIDARAREPGKPADAYAMKRELEAAEEGQDLSAETAQNLQNRMGNQAINSMINKNSNNAQEGAGLEVEVEEEQEVEVEEDAPDKDEDASEHEDARSQYGGSAGRRAASSSSALQTWTFKARARSPVVARAAASSDRVAWARWRPLPIRAVALRARSASSGLTTSEITGQAPRR